MNYRPGSTVACPVCTGYGCKFCEDVGWVTESRAAQWPDDATRGEYWAMLSNLQRPDDTTAEMHQVFDVED